VHSRNGVSHLAADTEDEAFGLARLLLGYVGRRSPGAAPLRASRADGLCDPARHLPASHRQGYDIRGVISDLSDDQELLEISRSWARNIVTAFCRLGGRPVGVVANNPGQLGGMIDSAASEKGARFVDRCDRFGLPVIALVDTPGFMPGVRQEATGVIRYGAEFLRSFARATVPRLTVVLRKAYGGAYITMNSKQLGADLTLAWEGAEIGIMAREYALTLMKPRPVTPEASEDVMTEFALRHLDARAAVEGGFLDDVIQPRETASRLRGALDELECRHHPELQEISR
jgi:acetyl-CoA carboxylase carboxyltransferase component